MSCSVNLTLREISEPRKYHWSRLCGFSVAELQAHIERQFTLPGNEGMNWDRFIACEIDLDHITPQSWFPYRSSSDLAFKDCWALANYQPMWSRANRVKGARFAGAIPVDPAIPNVTGSHSA